MAETPATSDPLKLIEAAAHALRSYQYGNAAPDLAEGVAEACEAALPELRALIDQPQPEIEGLRAWIDDLQSGMYVNCVYCGHRYGPKETTPVSMADALKRHVAQCEHHPMARMATVVRHLIDAHEDWEAALSDAKGMGFVFDDPISDAVKAAKAIIAELDPGPPGQAQGRSGAGAEASGKGKGS